MDSDIYVLAIDRSAARVIEVLNKYLPQRNYQLADQNGRFEFWDDSEEEGNQSSTFFNTELDLFEFLETQSGILFRPSFRSIVESDCRVMTLYYFEDNSLVIGINIHQDSDKEDKILEELKELLHSEYGYVSYHMPPAYGKEAFIKQCESLK